MSEHNYELKKGFEYAYKGESQTAQFITLTAPTYKQVDKVTPIKQAFMSAISEVQTGVEVDDAAEVDANEKITGAQVMQLMYRWSGDLTKIFLHAAELFKSGLALVDGEVKMTAPLIEKMDMTDVEGLLGDFIANFIAPSLMDGQ